MIDRWMKLSADFPIHHKTVDLKKYAEDKGAPLCLLLLWFYMQTRVPSDGILRGLTDELIEKKAKWDGEKGKLINALIKSGYACYWKDIEKRGRGGKGYIKRWYDYQHPDADDFEAPDDEDLILMNWFKRNSHLHPDVMAKKSAIAKANRSKGK